MKSLLNKRLPGILAVALVALAVGAANASASATSSSAGATASSLNKAQKKKRAKELKRCKKVRKAKPRRACTKRVKKKWNRIIRSQKGKTHRVDVLDDYYSPSIMNIRLNDSIRWDWRNANGREPHNVSLAGGPPGVSPYDFESQLRTGPYTFTRQFKKRGDYQFFCSLHVLMTMQVKVK